MFKYIKENYKKGDKLIITCVNGKFSGEIDFISSDSIILKSLDGRKCGIKGSDISFFEEMKECIPKNTKDNIELKNTESNTLVECEAGQTNVTEKQSDQPSFAEQDKESHKNLVNPSVSQYKPGDKIPLNLLHQIDPNTAKPRFPKKIKATKKFNSLESLSELVEEEHNIQNEKFVPALGEISFAKPENNYGFITDGKSNKRLYFSLSQIVDEAISKFSSSMIKTPVVYSILTNEHGEMAVSIHKPNKVSELLALAKELAKNYKINHANNILDHILFEYPDNYSAYELKRKLEKKTRSI
jgi:hypothetical protein